MAQWERVCLSMPESGHLFHESFMKAEATNDLLYLALVIYDEVNKHTTNTWT